MEPTAGSASAPSPSLRERSDRIVGYVEGAVLRGRRAAWDFVGFFQFLIFLAYLALSVVGFWLGLLAGVLGSLRLLIRLGKATLLYLSGGHPPPIGGRREALGESVREEASRLWGARTLLYADVTRPLARHIVSAQVAWRRFLHWTIVRELATVVVVALLIALPLAFVIPRPHEVQISDDNALEHTDGRTRYLVHAVELDDPGHHLEYENEYAPYLGKFDPQGLKSQLQPGKSYRLWVVGIRWYFFPRSMFPNIIWATEIDRNTRAATGPTLVGVPPAGTVPCYVGAATTEPVPPC